MARFGRWLIANVVVVGIVGFAVSVLIRSLPHGEVSQRDVLVDALTWLVGVNAIIAGSGHMFIGARVAEGIGWAPSPFQWEVGLASLSYGVLGSMASSYGRDFWLATIVAYSVFMLGAAVGHVRQMITAKNFAPGNAGLIFWYDLAAPAVLIGLYATL